MKATTFRHHRCRRHVRSDSPAFKLVVVKQIPRRADLVQRCSTWLDAYARHEEEQYLRCLIAGFLDGYAMQAPTTMRVNRLPTTPKRVELLEVNQLINHAMAAY